MAAQTTTTAIDVAEQVAIDIKTPMNSWEWLITNFACDDLFLLEWSNEDLQTLQIGVVALSEEDDRDPEKGGTRKHVAREHVVHVFFQKMGVKTKADIKALAAFVFQVKDYWMTARRTFSNANFKGLWVAKAKVLACTTPKAEMERVGWAARIALTFREVTEQ